MAVSDIGSTESDEFSNKGNDIFVPKLNDIHLTKCAFTNVGKLL
jgi:hypothetical protein